MTKRFFLPAFTAFGIATLCLLAILGPLISSSHLLIYHTSGPALMLFATALFDLGMLWALFTAVLLLAEKPGRRQFMIWAAIVLALPAIVLKNASMLTGYVPARWMNGSLLALSLTAYITLAIYWKPAFLSRFQRAQRFLTVVFGFVALNGILVVGQLLWYGWQARGLNTPIALHQSAAGPAGPAAGPRVIWIVLDELSYQQVYERRFPNLKLPAFDEIARQSTVFTHVVPAGNFTEEVLPALITGLPVDRIRVSSNGKALSLHRPDTERWQAFDPHQTVFQDALNAGYSTAVAGWFNPYCRILPQVLDRCFWTYQLPNPGGIVAGRSLTDNVLHEIVHRVESTSTLLPGNDSVLPMLALEAEMHIADYLELRTAGDSILTDPHAGFVFLHMPIPHPDGIYDRRNQRLTTGPSSYLDNLALADSYLAHVRELLQQHGTWDSSAVVIMGDHSWRTSLIWANTTSWTPEEQAASHGGQFDDRPAYIVKLPHQQQSARIDLPFKAIDTRSLLDALIADQLHTPDDLKAWAKKQN
ncbi:MULTISPECIES: sulfatase-like hydrolase/transferase [Acidobacteriaceae]|uniref:sulfatase-like hydrolase/transferase n=1 Tax=Acidobacteriaceae TaxID=204434 RepID=UPI00131E2340|nr:MULTISPECIES: sulfatase-like hydrolase/transferase [Acidobacteriaceae]MDW5265599.1 sulfatase-like hydrolase/transferase [Edaphobacter sp.]